MKRIKEFLKKIFKVEYIKYYAIGLAVLIVIILLLMQRCTIQDQQNQINQLNNQLSGDLVKLKEGLYRSQTDVVEKIKKNDKEVINEEIKKVIKDNKLDAVYASQIETRLKVQELIADKTKPVIVVNNSDKPNIPVPQEVVDSCNSCLSKTKIRIPFVGEKGPIHVEGWAETGEKVGLPGNYQLDIRLLKELTLNIVLTQDKDKKWSTVVSDPSGTMEVLGIKSKINIKPFKPSFKNRIIIPVGVAAGGQIVLLRMGLYFELTNKISLGLDAGGILNYKSLPSSDGFIGVGFLIRPFN